MATELEGYLNLILTEKTEKIIPENIKKDVQIFDITGTLEQGSGTEINNQDKTITENGAYTADEGYTGLGTVTVNVPQSGGVDTSDATAVQNEILEGKTAYIAEGKVIGTMPDTGLAGKVYRYTTNGYGIMDTNNTAVLSGNYRYNIVFSSTGKYCARVITSGSTLKLALYKIENDIFTNITTYNLSICNTNVNKGVYKLYPFQMISDPAKESKCYLYVSGSENNLENRWHSIVPIDFESDTPIVADNIFQWYPGDGGKSSIILLQGRPDICLKFQTDNNLRYKVYLAKIDYTAKTFTTITSMVNLTGYDCRNCYKYLYDFSEDGKTMMLTPHYAYTTDSSSFDSTYYKTYILRFYNNFESFKVQSVPNCNIGCSCISADGSLLFNNGKLYSITNNEDNTVNINRVGTANVIAPLADNGADATMYRPYFTSDNSKLVVMLQSGGTKLYDIDLTGNTTTSTYFAYNENNIYFSYQTASKVKTYGLGVYNLGKLYAVLPEEVTKELVKLEYNGDSYNNLAMLETTGIASNLLEGKIMYNSSGKVIGTMPNNGELSYTPSNSIQTIPAGYTSGGTINVADITVLNDYEICLELSEHILSGTSRYTELQYLESNAAQYINTGYRHKANTNIEIKFRQSSSNASQYVTLFGARKTNYTANAFSFFTRFANNNFCLCRTGNETKGTAIYDTDITLNVNGKVATYTNGTNTYTITTTGTLDEGVNDFLLFNTNTGGANQVTLADTDTSGMRIYYCKIYEGETLVRDFIPVKDRITGTIGMLDKLTNTMYANAGSGEFTYE